MVLMVLGICLFVFSVKLFHCVEEGWLLSSFGSGPVFMSVSVGAMAPEASGHLAGGRTPAAESNCCLDLFAGRW